MTIINGTVLSPDLGALIKWVAAKLHAVHNDVMLSADKVYEKYVNLETTDWARYNVKNVSWASSVELVNENWKLPQLNKFMGAETSFIVEQFGWVITISKMAMMNNEYASDVNALKELSESVFQKRNKHAATMLINGWNTNVIPGLPITKPTGVSRLFSVAHTLANGDTFSNTLANSAALSPDSLKDAKKMLMTQRKDNGDPISSSGKFILVVWPALEDLAKRIVTSDLRQWTANNDTNTLKNFEIVVDQYLASEFGWIDTAWYVIDKKISKLTYVERQAPNFETEVEFLTKNLQASVDAYWAMGFSDVRGIVGSKWDGSTITD